MTAIYLSENLYISCNDFYPKTHFKYHEIRVLILCMNFAQNLEIQSRKYFGASGVGFPSTQK